MIKAPGNSGSGCRWDERCRWEILGGEDGKIYYLDPEMGLTLQLQMPLEFDCLNVARLEFGVILPFDSCLSTAPRANNNDETSEGFC